MDAVILVQLVEDDHSLLEDAQPRVAIEESNQHDQDVTEKIHSPRDAEDDKGNGR